MDMLGMDQSIMSITVLTPVLLIVLLLIIIIVAVVLLSKKSPKKAEGLVPWDTFNARFQQERDGPIGATSAGDSLLEKRLDHGEGLVGGYNPPVFDEGAVELPTKELTDIEHTENALEYNLHGQ